MPPKDCPAITYGGAMCARSPQLVQILRDVEARARDRCRIAAAESCAIVDADACQLADLRSENQAQPMGLSDDTKVSSETPPPGSINTVGVPSPKHS